MKIKISNTGKNVCVTISPDAHKALGLEGQDYISVEYLGNRQIRVARDPERGSRPLAQGWTGKLKAPAINGNFAWAKRSRSGAFKTWPTHGGAWVRGQMDEQGAVLLSIPDGAGDPRPKNQLKCRSDAGQKRTTRGRAAQPLLPLEAAIAAAPPPAPASAMADLESRSGLHRLGALRDALNVPIAKFKGYGVLIRVVQPEPGDAISVHIDL